MEQQGFLDKHLNALDGEDFNAKSRARHFFIKMAEQGGSHIAKEVVKKYQLNESPSTKYPQTIDSELNEYAVPDQALSDQESS